MPGSGIIPAISGLQIGVVSQLESDPDGEDRILVQISDQILKKKGSGQELPLLMQEKTEVHFSDRKSEMRSSSVH
jgi:hypothetical protein